MIRDTCKDEPFLARKAEPYGCGPSLQRTLYFVGLRFDFRQTLSLRKLFFILTPAFFRKPGDFYV